MIVYSESYLMHHGVLGQKWGVRRYQNPDGTRTAAGKKHLKDKRKNVEDKKEGAATTAAAIAFLLAPMALTVGESFALSKIPEIREKTLHKDIMKSKLDPKTGLPLKNKEMTSKEDLKKVNPAFNPNFTTKNSEGTRNNCMLCTTAYDLRRRGFNVTAIKTDRGFMNSDIKKWYPKVEEKKHIVPEGKAILSRDYTNQILDNLSKEQNSRGNLTLSWKNGGGHSIAYEVNNGKVTLLDGQINKIYNNSKDEYYPLNRARISSVTTFRLDNVEPNYEKLKKEGLIAYDFSSSKE